VKYTRASASEPYERSEPRYLAALYAYAVIAAAHLVSLAAGVTWLEWTTKFLLVPSLVVWVVVNRGPRMVVAALTFGALGDMALQFDRLFIVGMGFFAAGHVCYVTYFLRTGRPRWYTAVFYGVAWAGLVVFLWPSLGALQIPVAAYSLLLTGTAITSSGLGARTGIGGLLFFVSDGLIALRLAELPQPPMPDLWIMSTYIVAQYLLASGALRAAPVTAARPLVRPVG
jgi:uncharacterized membrane protein YhhN